MSLLERAPVQIDPHDAQALFEEARTRTRRRRRRRRALAAIVLLGLVAIASFAATGGGGAATIAQTPTSPFADARALAGHGELAFVSRGRLWVLDGESGTLTAVSRPHQNASNPQFSPDGRWLAFAVGDDELWVARADGRSARPLGGLGATDGQQDWLPDGRARAASWLWRLASDGRATRTAPAPTGLIAWAGDGSAYAFVSSRVTERHALDWKAVERLSLSASLRGRRTSVIVLHRSFAPASGLSGPGIDRVAVLPNRAGVLFNDPGDVDFADGSELFYAARGAAPRPLGVALGIPLTLGAGGSFALERGGNRYAWQGKSVALCSAISARCRVLPAPRGVLTIDPALSPATGTLAFVEASSTNSATIGQTSVHRWYRTHTLWVLRAGAARPVPVPGTRGAAAPLWSTDGRSLLFGARNALWLLANPSARPVRVAAPLFDADVWPSYYGQVAWPSQFAWSAAAQPPV